MILGLERHEETDGKRKKNRSASEAVDEVFMAWTGPSQRWRLASQTDSICQHFLDRRRFRPGGAEAVRGSGTAGRPISARHPACDSPDREIFRWQASSQTLIGASLVAITAWYIMAHGACFAINRTITHSTNDVGTIFVRRRV